MIAHRRVEVGEDDTLGGDVRGELDVGRGGILLGDDAGPLALDNGGAIDPTIGSNPAKGARRSSWRPRISVRRYSSSVRWGIGSRS